MKQSLLRDIVYSDIFMSINRRILSLFYDSRYLRGKFFEEQRYGFVWAWKSVFRSFFLKRRGIVWPISSQCRLASGKNMSVCPSSLNIFQQPGCYFQNYRGKITIGENVWIAQNVGLITENHDPYNPEKHLEPKDIVIGDGCWIGMNAVVLPGVKLGNGTIVGAGAIVTHSFEGHCIIAGNPARLLKYLK